MNEQLNPQSPQHLRRDPIVAAWIAELQRDDWRKHEDCSRCGWPHSSAVLCGMGATFGKVRLGDEWCYIDTSNVAYMRKFVDDLSALGFHWRNQIYAARKGANVIVSHLEYYNGHPSVKQWAIPVAEFASIVCAVSAQGETGERYQATMQFLK